jgi:uncharacterized phage infection (PIP) family protein YhgE
VKAILAKHKPKETTQEKWVEHWNNAKYTLDPLVAAINDLIADIDEVKDDDFESPNHYAKLMYRAGQLKMAKKIVDIICS